MLMLTRGVIKTLGPASFLWTGGREVREEAAPQVLSGKGRRGDAGEERWAAQAGSQAGLGATTMAGPLPAHPAGGSPPDGTSSLTLVMAQGPVPPGRGSHL